MYSDIDITLEELDITTSVEELFAQDSLTILLENELKECLRFVLIFKLSFVCCSAKAYSTWYSQAVSHPSTDQARPCLASEIRRDRACSGWYGRKRWTHSHADVLSVKKQRWWRHLSFSITLFWSLQGNIELLSPTQASSSPFLCKNNRRDNNCNFSGEK